MMPNFNVPAAINDLCAFVALALFVGAVLMWAA